MAEEKMALLDVLRKGEEPGGDVLVDGLRWLLQELMDAEVSAQIGGGRYERSGERTTQRNGYRTRPWDTRLGTLELAIPKLRQGSYFPSWLEPRRRAEQALVAVVAEAYVQGVSTRKVEALVQSLGIAGLSKSEVSRLCSVLDEQAEIFRTRPLDAVYPYIWLDARYEHVREGGRVVSMAVAVIVAYGVRADGIREVLGVDVGPSEDVAVWRTFLQDLVARGARGVRLVTSDAHAGLKQAIAEVFVGAAWMRCRVHFMRNVLARVSKTAQAMVAATVRTIFEQPDRASAAVQLRHVCDMLAPRFPAVVHLVEDAESEILTFYLRLPSGTSAAGLLDQSAGTFEQRTQATQCGGRHLPNRQAVLRLFCALLAEQNDEWLVGQHRYFSEASMAKILNPKEDETAAPLPPQAAAA
jgi:putative transposase